MLRFRVRSLSLIHGVLAASAWVGVTVATRAPHVPLSAGCRHAAPFLRTARVLLVVFGFAFGSLAFAQTASFSYAITSLGNGFSSPTGVEVDGSGNVYVADHNNSAVKEMPAGCASSSCVTTLGGGFSLPFGVTVDGSGNVYVADTYNSAVKEMPAGCASSSCVTTLGGGFSYPWSVTVDGSGNVYVADYDNNAVKEMPAGCTSSSCVTTLGGEFNHPSGVGLDGSGNVYVADSGNGAVKEMPAGCASSSCVTTLGGAFGYPTGVAVDGSGNVYVGDQYSNAVKEMPAGCASSSCVTTLGGGLDYPTSVALDGSGNVYVADEGSNAVKEIMTRGVNFFTIPVGTASAALTLTFTFESAGSLSSTTPYQVVTQGAQSLDFNAAATQESNACSGTTAYTASETCTVDVTFTPTRAGSRYGAVELLNAGGSTIATAYVYGTGTGPQVVFSPITESTLGGPYNLPLGVAADASGNIYVADANNNAVEEMPAGCASSSCMTELGGGFNGPEGVAVDGSGNVYVADTSSSEVKEMPAGCASMSCVTVIGGFINHPTGVTVDGSGNVYVADNGGSSVQEFPPGCASSSCVTTLGGGFDGPTGVTVDGSGNVYVADNGSSSVKEMPAGCASSSCVTKLGGGFSYTQGVAVDASGNVYVTDPANNAVKEMPAGCASSSCVTTLSTSHSYGVALDGSGNVYVSVAGANLVMELNRATPPSLSFASTVVGSTSSDSPQTVTVANIGNAPLTFPIPASGNDPSITANFTLNSSQSDACPLVSAGSSQPGTLAAGASCLLPISFKPSSGGNITGALTLTDNNLNSASPAYATQSLELSGTGATPPFGHIDSAVDNVTLSTTVAQSDLVVIKGWAADKIDGAPLSNVRVYIDGNLAGTPFLCLARPDVAAAYSNAAYTDSGYRFTYSAAALALGSHAVTVIAIDSGGRSTTFGPLAFTVAANAGAAAPTPPLGHLDSAVDSVTGSSTVGQSDSVAIRGWAADLIDGAPLSNVKVYVDGNLAGTPTLGVARPDVAAAYSNAAYLDSGYTLTNSVAALSLGSHAVTVIAIDLGGRSTTFGPLAFTIAATAGPAPPTPPFGHLDSAVDSLTGTSTVGQSDSVVVRGWAADQVDGAPLSNVKVYIDGILADTPTLGIARPDVATAKGAAYLDSGYTLTYSVAALSLGSHAVTVIAIDLGGRSTTFGPLDFTVQ
jgi:sugar lactone lactonase YvrE